MIVTLDSNPLKIIGHVSISCDDSESPIIQFVLGNDPVDATTIWTTWHGTDMIISNNPIYIKFVPKDARPQTPQDVKVDVRRIS